MPLKTSLFNRGIFKNNMKRFWLIPFSYTFFLFLFVMGYLNSAAIRLKNNFDPASRNFISSDLFGMSDTSMALFIAFFTLISALAVFSYIHFSKNTAMIHSLPLKRDTLFVTNYISGLLMVTIPLLLNGLIIVIYEAAANFPRKDLAFIWIGVCLVLTFLVYSFAVFAGMFTGHMAAHTIFFMIFNLLAVFLESMVNLVFTNFIFGYIANFPSANSSTDLNFKSFSPLANINVFFSSFANDRGDFTGLICYALAGILFAVSAMLLYRKRNLEVATDIISMKIVKPIFKYSVTFCSAALIGSIFVSMFNIRQDLLGYIITYLIGAFIGYFASEMLLKKTFRVLKAYKGFLVSAVILVLVLSSISFDLFGYESYVPKASEIEAVYVDQFPNPIGRLAMNPESYDPNTNRFLFADARFINNPPKKLTPELIKELRQVSGVSEGSEAIEKARAIHSYIVEHQGAFNEANKIGRTPVAIEKGTGPSYRPQSIYFCYRLKNGKIVERQYNLAYYQNTRELDAVLTGYLTVPEVEAKYQPVLSKKPEDIMNITIIYGAQKGDAINTSISDVAGFLEAYKKDIKQLEPIDNFFLGYIGSDYTGIDVIYQFTQTNQFEGYKFNGSRPITTQFTNTIKYLIDSGYITNEQLKQLQDKIMGK